MKRSSFVSPFGSASTISTMGLMEGVPAFSISGYLNAAVHLGSYCTGLVPGLFVRLMIAMPPASPSLTRYCVITRCLDLGSSAISLKPEQMLTFGGKNSLEGAVGGELASQKGQICWASAGS